MSIGNAKKFIRKAMDDKKIRSRINAAGGSNERAAVLEDLGLGFTYPEFDDAFNNLLTQCQREGDAELLREFRMWWDMVRDVNPGGTASPTVD